MLTMIEAVFLSNFCFCICLNKIKLFAVVLPFICTWLGKLTFSEIKRLMKDLGIQLKDKDIKKKFKVNKRERERAGVVAV